LEHKRQKDYRYYTISDVVAHVKTLKSVDSDGNTLKLHYTPGRCWGFGVDEMEIIPTLNPVDGAYARYLKSTFHYFYEPNDKTYMVIIKGVSHAYWIMLHVEQLLARDIESMNGFGGNMSTRAMTVEANSRLQSVDFTARALSISYTSCNTGLFFVPNAISSGCTHSRHSAHPIDENLCSCHVTRYRSVPAYGSMVVHEPELAARILHSVGDLGNCTRLTAYEFACLFCKILKHSNNIE